VRVFGEMVALLWADGDRNGALVLEELWNDLTRRMSFPLLCAYPARFFSTDPSSILNLADISSPHEPRTSAAKLERPSWTRPKSAIWEYSTSPRRRRGRSRLALS
jgi:hypothetical protein